MRKKGYTGRSREHSLNRRGIQTAGKPNTIERYPPKMMEETKPMYFHNYIPKVFCDRGAGDGEPFCWIDFGDDENYPEHSQFVVIMNDGEYEVVDFNGNVRLRTSSLDEAIDRMKQEYITQWKIDAINSPMGRMLGWVERDKAELTKEGKEVHNEFTRLVKASGKKIKQEIEYHDWESEYDAGITADVLENQGYEVAIEYGEEGSGMARVITIGRS